jgi:hypothetical protein
MRDKIAALKKQSRPLPEILPQNPALTTTQNGAKLSSFPTHCRIDVSGPLKITVDFCFV